MHSKKSNPSTYLYLYTCIALAPAAASEKPNKSRASSPEQHEGYGGNFDSSEESSQGTHLIAYNNAAVAAPAADHVHNILVDQPVQLGEIHEERPKVPVQQHRFGLPLQQGEPDHMLHKTLEQTKKELTDELSKLDCQQKSLKRRLKNLKQKNEKAKDYEKILEAYHNSLQLHEHKLTQWISELEALCALDEADPDLHNLINKADNLQDGLDELTLDHHLLVNPDAHVGQSYCLYQPVHCTEDALDEWEYEIWLQRIRQSLAAQAAPRQPFLACLNEPNPNGKYAKKEFQKIQKEKNSLHRKQVELKAQQDELKRSLQSHKGNKNRKKSLKKWQKKFQKHKSVLQAYKRELTNWGNRLKDEFFVSHWYKHQIKAMATANDKLWRAFEALIKGQDALEKLRNPPAQQKTSVHDLEQKENNPKQDQLIQWANKLKKQQNEFNEWEKRLKEQQKTYATHEAGLKTKQNQLTQWQKRLQQQQEAQCMQEVELQDQQKHLTQQKQKLKKQQQTYARQSSNLARQQDELAQWEAELEAQQQACTAQQDALCHKENELIQWEQELNYYEDTYTQPYEQENQQQYVLPINSNKALQLHQAYNQLYDTQTQLHKWQTKLRLDAGCKNWAKQCQIYKRQFKAYRKRIRLWHNTLHNLIATAAPTPLLQELKSHNLTLQTSLEQLIRQHNELDPTQQAHDNPNHNRQVYQPKKAGKKSASDLVVQCTKLQNQLTNLKKCQANLHKKNGSSDKWKKQAQNHKKNLQNYQRRISIWEYVLNQRLQAQKGEPALQALCNKKHTLRNELKKLIKTSCELPS